MKDHTVVVPDLRGIGRSSEPAGGYDKKTQAKDIRAVVTSLGYDKTFVVAHDIGNMVAYANAAICPDKVERVSSTGAWQHINRVKLKWEQPNHNSRPSRPGEFHPEPLTDPCLTVSSHTARATQ